MLLLKDVLPEPVLVLWTAAFVGGIGVAGLWGFKLPPLGALALELTVILAYFYYFTLRAGKRRQDLELQTEAVRRLSLYLGRLFIILWFCLGFLQQGAAAWPRGRLFCLRDVPCQAKGLLRSVRLWKLLTTRGRAFS